LYWDKINIFGIKKKKKKIKPTKKYLKTGKVLFGCMGKKKNFFGLKKKKKKIKIITFFYLNKKKKKQ